MSSIIPNSYEPKLYTDITPISSRFIELRDGEIFDIKMQYAALQMESSVSQCFVREEVYEKLISAQSLLPNNFKLRIWDAWRPFALQKELYVKYSQSLIKQFGLENKSYGEQQRIIKKYISLPDDNREAPPVHTTRGAVKDYKKILLANCV